MADTSNPEPGSKPEPSPYELEPPPAPSPPAPSPAQGSPTAGSKSPKLSADPVLTGFDEDEDFDKDPEVERALGKKKPKSAAEEDSRTEYIKPGFGSAQVWGIVGGFLLVGAVVFAAMHSKNKFAVSLLTIYSGLIHTGTGMVAVYLAAKLNNQRVGQIELAAGRMLTAVSAFLLIFNLNIPLAGDTKWEEIVLGVLAYAGILAGLFRVWSRQLGILAGLHFVLWLLFGLGMTLSAWASSGAATGVKG